MHECGVLYLDRWGNNPHFSRAFLSSLHRHQAGAAYDLIYILKGYPEDETSAPLERFIQETGQEVRTLRVADDRFATSTIFDVARTLTHEKMIFFISWCRILSDSWLGHYLNAFDSVRNCGIVGATGGFERTNYKDLSQPFPNIGIRTTSFLMSRKQFVALANGRVETREQELAFESGPESLTKLLMRQNFNPTVVDRYGKTWAVEEWPFSKTFRSGYQEGLLVADNRTHDYDISSPARRLLQAEITWGPNVAEAPPVSRYKRMLAQLTWKHGPGDFYWR